MYRLAWGNGPVDCATYAAKDIPNTLIHDTDTFCPSMQHFHLRVRHRWDGTGQSAWEWYSSWRALKNAWDGKPEYGKIHGLALDEIITNHENIPVLVQKIHDVSWWCQSAGLPQPDWVVAITPGNEVALKYIVETLNNNFPGKIWWFAETYLTCKEGADYGLARANDMVRMMADVGVQSRTVYGLNHSHYGAGSCEYYNSYGTPPNVPNLALRNAIFAFCAHVMTYGTPFGFGVWTPHYSTPISRADVHDAFLAVGCG